MALDEITIHTDPTFIAPVAEPPEKEAREVENWQDIPIFAQWNAHPMFQGEIWLLCDKLSNIEHLSFKNDPPEVHKVTVATIALVLRDYSEHWFGNGNELSQYFTALQEYKGIN